MLADNGGLAEADALLEAAARLPPVDADEGYSIARFPTRRATLKAQAGDVVGALEVLDAGLQRFGIDGTYGANFVANASALLAETGRYAEALALLDRLPRPKGKSLKIGETFVNADGAIQLTWIRACALRGLGQAGAANAELNRFLANAYATDNVRARALTCFGDVDRLTRFFVTALEGAAGHASCCDCSRAIPIAPTNLAQR